MADNSAGASNSLTGTATAESKHERHMRVMTERLSKIEQDSSQAKPTVYSQKLAQLKEEMQQIQLGTHPEFEYRLAQLDRERQLLEDKAQLWKQYQDQLAMEMYRSECEFIEQEYRQEKDGMKERILQQIDERRRKIREERDQLSIESAIIHSTSSNGGNVNGLSGTFAGGDSGSRGNQRKSVRKRNAGEPSSAGTVLDARARKRQLQGPLTAPLLKESEIMEDFVVLSKVSDKRCNLEFKL